MALPTRHLPDLSGSIVVLTHARTGSSLLMQTLRLLGADVIGAFERPDLPQSANPKGYFEDRDLLRLGLSAPALHAQPDLLRGRAVKVALRPLVARRSQDEWASLADTDVTLLLPIRNPAESLLSRQVFLGSDDVLERNALFHRSARNRLLDFGFLAERIGTPGFAGPVPVCIDYKEAVDDPASYVGRIATASGLCPTAAQVSAATTNIDRGLYRVRLADDGPAGVAAAVRPLERIHGILRSADHDKWARLRDSLPPWLRDAGREPLSAVRAIGPDDREADACVTSTEN